MESETEASIWVLTVGSRKGGVGKTASAANLAYALREAGRRVVVVDLDHQGDITYELGVELEPESTTIAEVLSGEATVDQAVVELADGLGVVPADDALEVISDDALGGPGSVVRALAGALAGLARLGWDVAILDTHPDNSTPTRAAFATSDAVLVLVTAQSSHSVRNIGLVSRAIEEMAADTPTRFLLIREQVPRKDGLFRRRTARAIDESAIHHLGDRLLSTRIVDSAAVHDQTVTRVPIMVSAPDSLVATQFRRVAQELLPLLSEA